MIIGPYTFRVEIQDRLRYWKILTEIRGRQSLGHITRDLGWSRDILSGN